MGFHPFKKIKEQLKKVTKRLPLKKLRAVGVSVINERDRLLRSAALYYEFPMLSIEKPPGNDYVDYCLTHAQHRNGFEASTHTGAKKDTKSYSGSKIQVGFSGVINGKQIKSKKPWINLVTKLGFLLGIGGIIAIIIDPWDATGPALMGVGFGLWGLIQLYKFLREKPKKATILYWGVNVYQPLTLMELIQDMSDKDKILDSIKIDQAGTIFNFGVGMHPIQTILHVAIGFEISGKLNQQKEQDAQRFEFFKQVIQEELSMKPVVYDADKASSARETKPLFKKVLFSKDLKDLRTRFPY